MNLLFWWMNIAFATTKIMSPNTSNNTNKNSSIGSSRSCGSNPQQEEPSTLLTASSSSFMPDTFGRLVDKLRPLLLQAEDGQQQHWIGVAGGPGSGKTTTAEAVANQLNELVPNCALVIPMDGWHYPKMKLLQLQGEEGYKRRGAPWTYDVDKCWNDLKQAKERREASLPIYSREISDPVENGIHLNRSHKIVFVEGNYVLLQDDPQWGKLMELWDQKWFVKCPTREIQIERLVKRSLKTWHKSKAQVWGPGEEGARKRVYYNDVENMDTVSYCESLADEVIVSS